jgi:hypothetical protein
MFGLPGERSGACEHCEGPAEWLAFSLIGTAISRTSEFVGGPSEKLLQELMTHIFVGGSFW